MAEVQILCISNDQNNGGSNHNPSGCSTQKPPDVPEKKVVLFALYLAFIETTSSVLRLVRTNVIFSSGFFSNLKHIDFWFATTIIVLEGTRLFIHICEVQLQQQSICTIPANTSDHHIQSHSLIPFRLVGVVTRALFITSPRIVPYKIRQLDEGTALSEPKRTGLPADDPLLTYPGRKIVKTIVSFLYSLQFFLTSVCVVVSLMRLLQQDYGDKVKINEKSSINVFYSLALAQALMFFLEMGYWIWTIEVQKLFTWATNEYGFSDMSMGFLLRFFDEAYSNCSEGRIGDVLNMDLFSFAKGLLNSNSREQHIMGATILQQIVEQKTQLADRTLNKIGNSTPVLKRLIEMLNWKDTEEKNIRRSASEIVFKLTSDERQALLVAAIPEAMKSIASLLHSGRGSTNGRPYEASLTEIEAYDFSTFSQLGLQILEHLARDHGNCLMIMNDSGLLSRIVVLTSASKSMLQDLVPESSWIMTVRLALQVVKTLACTTKQVEILQKDILEKEDLLRNIKDLLQHGKSHLELQMLGLEILASLGSNVEGREKIENIEGMLKVILGVFFQRIEAGKVEAVHNKAGEMLTILIHESTSTCKKILKIKKNVVMKLVHAFGNVTLKVNAACILRDICAYLTPSTSTYEKLLELNENVGRKLVGGFGNQDLCVNDVDILNSIDFNIPQMPEVMPMAMESLASLLHSGRGSTNGRPYEASLMEVEAYNFSTFNQLGLQILENLARDHNNCLMIMNAPGLLSRIVVLTSANEEMLSELVPESSRIMTVRLALQVVKTLACATKQVGEIIQKDVLGNEDLLRNIKDLLQYGKSHLELQMLGLEILASLGSNVEEREKIENIEGMLKVILGVFFQRIEAREVVAVHNKAGEVLAILIHESTSTCKKILKIKKNIVMKLVHSFGNVTLKVNAACILRDICAYHTTSTSTYEKLLELKENVGRKLVCRFDNQDLWVNDVGILNSIEFSILQMTEVTPIAMESIESLLHSGRGSTNGRPYEVSLTEVEAYNFSTFNQLGLQILENLARDHDNCLMIRKAPDLLSRIVVLTTASKEMLSELVPESSRIMTVRLALQVVKTLACATKQVGEIIQKDVLENEDLLRNINDLLQYGKSHSELQILGLEILASLGRNVDSRDKIENIEGMLKVILGVFCQPIEEEKVATVCNKAGEVLAILIHGSTRARTKLLMSKKNVVRKLVDAFGNRTLRVNAACILRDICAYLNPSRRTYEKLLEVKEYMDRVVYVGFSVHNDRRLDSIEFSILEMAEVMPMVLKSIMEEKEKENEKLLEVSIELASQILNFRDPRIHGNEITMAGIADKDFVQKLVEILTRYKNVEINFPTIRISVIKLSISLMKYKRKYIRLFRNLGMEKVLMEIAETKFEFECCIVFSGRKSESEWFEINISNSVKAALSVLLEEQKIITRRQTSHPIISSSEDGMEETTDPIISYVRKNFTIFNYKSVNGLIYLSPED